MVSRKSKQILKDNFFNNAKIVVFVFYILYFWDTKPWGAFHSIHEKGKPKEPGNQAKAAPQARQTPKGENKDNTQQEKTVSKKTRGVSPEGKNLVAYNLRCLKLTSVSSRRLPGALKVQIVLSPS